MTMASSSTEETENQAGGHDAFSAVPVMPPSISISDVGKQKDKSSAHTGNPLGSVVVISGGSGYNDLVGATPGATYVMPISDDGGSSSEIIRVLGGPSIGDIRSRLVRMIPTSTSYDVGTTHAPPPASNDAMYALLSHRLPTIGSARDIKQEWRDILEGRHALWRGIEPERKECIRGFLVYFEGEILRRVHRNFDFRAGSIGNFFLAAAQMFFRSIQSAIFLFGATALIPLHGSGESAGGRVLPVINTNHTATIGAVLEDGQTIIGQCEISHPSSTNNTTSSFSSASEAYKNETQAQLLPPSGRRLLPSTSSGIQSPSSAAFDPFQSTPLFARLKVGNYGDGLDPSSDGESDADDDTLTAESHKRHQDKAAMDDQPRKKAKRSSNIVFSKADHGVEAGEDANGIRTGKENDTNQSPLGSRIARLFYVNAYGNEVDPAPNPEYLCALQASTTLLYSCGSLWTSIVPCLALRGVAKAITSSSSLRFKVLLLNTTIDRETFGLEAIDFVRVIAKSMQHADQLTNLQLDQVVTHIIYCPKEAIRIDVEELESLGIRCVPVELSAGQRYFDEKSVRQALDRIVELS